MDAKIMLGWSEICARHADEWVCLLDVEAARDGSIRCARVIAHDRSMRQVLARIDGTPPNAVVVHTRGRPLCNFRIRPTAYAA